ncbi:MAG: DNA gyrase inhibitor YacG [Aeromonadales bacterium]|nr:DNA gyrase inhibitor YacG [Aeromonadales bacterium]
MSLKDLLTPELFDEISKSAHDDGKCIEAQKDGPIKVKCPVCQKEIVYDVNNKYRPFCSERCKLIDLGAWANNERAITGGSMYEDDDAEMLNSPDLEKYHLKDEI